jgi:class 3 adenylate cyclase
VVGELIGEGEARDRGVVGDTPNLAARLQALGRAWLRRGLRGDAKAARQGV